MKKILQLLLILVIGQLTVFLGRASFAQEQQLLTYPIPELGHCRDAKECYLYCEIPENKPACWSYGTYKLGSQVLGETTDSAEDKEMEVEAKKQGITFPIAELGNCANVRECRTYCDNPTHQDACSAFAKKHGFDKGEGHSDQTNKQQLLQYARTELGCDSYDACRRICETDHERCMAFSRRHGINRGEGDTHKAEMLERARTELGCDSFESCRNICEQNHERCMAFTRKYGYDQGSSAQNQEQKKSGGPGGCNSEESCRRYCQEHPKECQGYQSQQEGTNPHGGYLGPSGCRTEAECKAYCETNPTGCPGFKTEQNMQYPKPSVYPTYEAPNTYNPADYCSKTPGCTWSGTSCTCSGTPSQTTQPPYPPPDSFTPTP